MQVFPSKKTDELCIAIESSKIRDFLDYIFLTELHRAVEYKNNRTLVAIDFDSYKLLLGVLKEKISDSASNAQTLKALDKALSDVTREEFCNFIEEMLGYTKLGKAIDFLSFGKKLLDGHK